MKVLLLELGIMPDVVGAGYISASVWERIRQEGRGGEAVVSRCLPLSRFVGVASGSEGRLMQTEEVEGGDVMMGKIHQDVVE